MKAGCIRRATGVVAPLLAALGLTACLSGADDCLPKDAPPTSAGAVAPASTIAVLSGVTVSERDSRIATDRKAAMTTVLNAGLRSSSKLFLVDIGATGQSRMRYNEPLKVDAVNPQVCESKLAALESNLQKAIDEQNQIGAEGGSDVLGGIATLASTLEAPSADRAVDVVMLSSMVNVTDALRLDSTGQWAREPQRVIKDLKGKGLVPDCRGWRVYAVGPGVTTSGGLDTTRLADLKLFWARFFEECGGQLWRFQGQLSPYPASGPDPRPPDPEVDGKEVQDLDASVLFDLGRSELRPSAASELDRLVAELVPQLSGGGKTVHVIGHTDSDGPEDANQQLSEQRARAVAQWISDHLSAASVRAYGYGERQPAFPNDTVENKARNRRVVVLVVGR